MLAWTSSLSAATSLYSQRRHHNNVRVDCASIVPVPILAIDRRPFAVAARSWLMNALTRLRRLRAADNKSSAASSHVPRGLCRLEHRRAWHRLRRCTTLLLWALMLGAGLLFGDGIITPSISVLSAVEGLHVAMPALGNAVIPITIGLLTGLFAIQFKGTSGIGIVFGPVLFVWFATIAVLGVVQIQHHPDILAAFNPIYGLSYLHRAGFFDTLLILSALMLVVTGGEAMYADVGHFGARPIQASWFAVVFPALLLNYLGQGAYRAQRRAGRGRQAVLQHGARTLGFSDGAARHRCDRHRFAGADFRSIFAGLASGPARSVSAARAVAHPRKARRPNLCAVRQLGAVCRLRALGFDLPLRFRAGRRLRLGRLRRDADHFARDVSYLTIL